MTSNGHERPMTADDEILSREELRRMLIEEALRRARQALEDEDG